MTGRRTEGRRWPLLVLAAVAAVSLAGVAISAGAGTETAPPPTADSAASEDAPIAVPVTRKPKLTLEQARADAEALGRPLTVVSLTFDDGTANQWTAVETLNELAMPATFYVPSGHVDGPDALTLGQLRAMEAAGHEIGGHTVNHADLVATTPDEAVRQICDDRSRLLDWGFDARSFAYPFARSTPAVQDAVRDCGYSSGRLLGALQSPTTCLDCPAVEDLVPAAPFALRALAQVETSWTLEDFQAAVLRAEQTGGWTQITFHNVCTSGCEISVTPAVFEQFTTWLAARQASHGTAVLTVGDVIGGPAGPAVIGPADPPTTADANAVRNPGFEEDAGGLPSCWMLGGYGDNAAVHDFVSPGRTGGVAARVRVSDYEDGDAKWLQRFDLGECSPAVEPGAKYDLGSWYSATSATQFSIYLRNDRGAWQYWTSSSWFPKSSSYRLATWTTPPIPDGYEAISFGLNVFHDGELIVDDVSLRLRPGTEGSDAASAYERVDVAGGVEVHGETEADRARRDVG